MMLTKKNDFTSSKSYILFEFKCTFRLGPRYIAPDLSDDDDGEQKFFVQSFLVSPEELTLLKPNHTWTTKPHSNGELTIDANMLRQLSEAGMTIGRQIETSAVDLILQSTKDAQTINKFAEQLNCTDPEQKAVVEKLFDKIKSIVGLVQQKSENGMICKAAAATAVLNGDNKMSHMQNGHSNGGVCNGEPMKMNGISIEQHLIDIVSTTIMDCVVACAKNSRSDVFLTENNCQRQQQSAAKPTKYRQPQSQNSSSIYEIIGQVLTQKLSEYIEEADTFDDSCSNGHVINTHDAQQLAHFSNRTHTLFGAIEKLLASPMALQTLESTVDSLVEQTIKVGKVNLIQATINKNIYNDTEILENICAVLQNENEDSLIDAVRELFDCEPKLLYAITAKIRDDAERFVDDSTIIETLKHCIISAVRQSADNDIKQITSSIESGPNEKCNIYLTDTIALAKALGLTNCAQNLMNLVNSNIDIGNRLEQDENLIELLQRVIVMHKLAKNNVERTKSLELLRTEPYTARKDSTLRELMRHSAICTSFTDEANRLKDSNEVPISLFYSDNQLAMEDFLIRRQSKSRGAFLIVKEGFQAVVPRESSRDVLIGKCAYTMLDENGIRHFEPLHVFSALKIKNVPLFAHRFSMYSCECADDNEADIDVESILTLATTTPMTTSSVVSSDFIKELSLLNGHRYRSKLMPRHDYTDVFTKRRYPLRRDWHVDGRQVNYRRSFYL